MDENVAIEYTARAPIDEEYTGCRIYRIFGTVITRGRTP